MEISNQDRSAITTKSTENIEAYDLVLRAKSKLTNLSSTAMDSVFEEIQSMLEQAVKLDPYYVDAKSSLAGSYLLHFNFRHSYLDTLTSYQLLENAISTAEQVLVVDPYNEIALSTLPIALIEKATGQLSGGDEFNPLLYRKAKILINNLAKYYPESPISNLALGTYYWYVDKSKLPIRLGNELQLTLNYHKKALASAEKILQATPNDPIANYTAYVSYVMLGNLYYDQGKYQESINFYLKMNENQIKALTKNGEYLLASRLGMTNQIIGEYDEALAFFKRSFELAKELGRSDNIVNNLYWLGRVYRIKGEYLMALHYNNKAFQIFREKGEKAGQGVLLHVIGVTKFLMGDYIEASEYFQEASELWIDIEDRRQNLWTLSWWSISELKLGNLEAALAKVKQTEEIMRETDPHSNDVIIVNWNLSQVYAGLGEKEKSHSCLKLAHDTVIKKANEFVDSKARETFLNKIRVNREVDAAWVKQQP